MFLEIEFKDGAIERYAEEQFTDYEYRDPVFVVKRANLWIGIYNMSYIKDVRCYEKNNAPIFD